LASGRSHRGDRRGADRGGAGGGVKEEGMPKLTWKSHYVPMSNTILQRNIRGKDDGEARCA
jgi:hypothetical protein